MEKRRMVEQRDITFKITAIIFFLLVFLINPFVWIQLSKHYFVFTLIFLVLGLCYYLRIPFPGRKICVAVNDLERRHGWVLVITQVLIFVLFQLINKNFLSYALHAGSHDEASYVNFNFSSWVSILGNHRTAGLPIIIKCYQLVFKDFYFWPHFQMISYVLSILFLYGCLTRFGFNKILSFVFVSLLLWDRPNYYQFHYVGSETMTAAFLNFSVGSMFLAIRNWNWKTAALTAITVFALYQIRANFAFVAVLMPLWAVAISSIKEGFEYLRIRKIFIRFFLLSILPLLLFCLLRLAVVGQFGVVSMAGGCLSGHAVHYLNESNIQYLSGDVRKLADEILFRKRQLEPPNNLSPFDWDAAISFSQKIKMQAEAFGADLITAWTVAIKQLKGVEPFDDPRHNIDPKKYGLPLSWFHARYYDHEVDRLLMRFSMEVLRLEPERFRRWLVGGSFYGMSLIIAFRSLRLTYLGFLGIGKLFYLLFAKGLDSVRLKFWHQDAWILTMLAMSVLIVGFIPLVVLNYPFSRLTDLITIYLMPALTCLALPPFWLKKVET